MKKLFVTPLTHHIVLDAKENFFPAGFTIVGHIGGNPIQHTKLSEAEIRKLRIWLTDLEVRLKRKREAE